MKKGVTEHYAKGGIEPIEFIMANDYGFNRGNICKYNHRVGLKAGEEEKDVLKIIDYSLLLATELGIGLKREQVLQLVNKRFDWSDDVKCKKENIVYIK